MKLEQFRPHDCVDRVDHIDLAELKSQGIDALLLDLDNTMLPWKDSIVPDFVRVWVKRAIDLGFGVCIVSNTHYPRRLAKISDDLGIAAISHAIKPRKRGFDTAAKMLGVHISKCAAIGDQLLTDILGGNRAGAYTILVRPMDPKEFLGTKISRLVEYAIFALLRRKSGSGTIREMIQSENKESK